MQGNKPQTYTVITAPQYVWNKTHSCCRLIHTLNADNSLCNCVTVTKRTQERNTEACLQNHCDMEKQ